jgi:phosphate transport system permease protein
MENGILGTVMLVIFASSAAIPVGMLAGVYLSEYDTDFWMTRPVRLVSDVLAGVPSILLGILGYELVVVPLGRSNGWAGALALAMIMIPMVVRSTEQMLRKVPDSYRDASIALGASKAMTILNAVIPSATGSIVTGIMLAIARVAGETAPLVFIAVGSRFLRPDPNGPFPSLTAQVFDFAQSGDPAQQRLAWSGIFVLISLIFVLNLVLRFVGRAKSSG